jgi:hypothetical protein
MKKPESEVKNKMVVMKMNDSQLERLEKLQK